MKISHTLIICILFHLYKYNYEKNILKNSFSCNCEGLPVCYEMDKTSIFMFEILEPGGSALGKYSI